MSFTNKTVANPRPLFAASGGLPSPPPPTPILREEEEGAGEVFLPRAVVEKVEAVTRRGHVEQVPNPARTAATRGPQDTSTVPEAALARDQAEAVFARDQGGAVLARGQEEAVLARGQEEAVLARGQGQAVLARGQGLDDFTRSQGEAVLARRQGQADFARGQGEATLARDQGEAASIRSQGEDGSVKSQLEAASTRGRSEASGISRGLWDDEVDTGPFVPPPPRGRAEATVAKSNEEAASWPQPNIVSPPTSFIVTPRIVEPPRDQRVVFREPVPETTSRGQPELDTTRLSTVRGQQEVGGPLTGSLPPVARGEEASRSLGRGEASRLNQFSSSSSAGPLLLQPPALLHLNATQVSVFVQFVSMFFYNFCFLSCVLFWLPYIKCNGQVKT